VGTGCSPRGSRRSCAASCGRASGPRRISRAAGGASGISERQGSPRKAPRRRSSYTAPWGDTTRRTPAMPPIPAVRPMAAIRPIEASKVAICNGRFTSTPAGRNARIADIRLAGFIRAGRGQKPSTPTHLGRGPQAGWHNQSPAMAGGAVERRATASVSYVRGKFGRSATALSRPIALSSVADKPSSRMRRAVSFSGTNGLSLPNKI
jgi:hypothetical protein